jgi:hypothetical protein
MINDFFCAGKFVRQENLHPRLTRLMPIALPPGMERKSFPAPEGNLLPGLDWKKA